MTNLYKVSENTNFTVSFNQVINGENVNDNLLKIIHIHCDGPGDIGIKLDLGDGTFGSTYTMKTGETLHIEKIIVTRIRIVYIADSAYRLLAY